ncbi:type VII secretion protein EccB [Thermocatellispora tengchongensis]|uniref:Type VII secretion protein EccB n=1 Tax=Thermocatellispora tengchongensis TaxID=1073253 RepID=A0A840PK56_9ACTN|nr:type VII secretion protein EccB [Thermocatellispora tengchongensis]MBB5138191.1 type VII secretion protein EccB [Thermocatellispora tengchongensis]
MQTRRDLYQAHRLMTQRLATALALGEPDVPESPARRHTVATFCGLLVAALVMAVFGIWGLIRPGGATGLTEPGTLIVEEGTGATYVYSAARAELLPVANYASARLLLDANEITVRTVSAASLERFPRGPMVGIPGAPDSLPEPGHLVRAPWSACVVEGADPSGGRRAYVSLVGGAGTGGRTLGAGRALLVDDGADTWLIWGDTRMRVPGSGAAALTQAQPRRVPATWLNALPAGPDFRAPDIPGRGRKTTGPGGIAAAVGQVVRVAAVAGGETRWYAVLRDGLAPLTQTQATLLLQDPASKKAYGGGTVAPIDVDAATANAAPRSATTLGGAGLPAIMPAIDTPPASAPLCAVYDATERGSARARVTVGGSVRPVAPEVAGTGGQEHFDQVVLPAGGAALVGLLPGEGQLAEIRTYYLVTDQGRRFRLAGPELLGPLGYGAQDVAPLPAHLLHLIPEGPVLDPVAARTPVRVGVPATAPP